MVCLKCTRVTIKDFILKIAVSSDSSNLNARVAQRFGISHYLSTAILLNLMIPLGLVFGLMVFMNLFLKPTHIVRFLGKETSSSAIILSVAAGVISMGPIYAWYPLLKEMRKKGTTNSLIAVFFR